MNIKLKEILLLLVSFVTTFHILLFYGLPFKIFLVIFSLLAITFIVIKGSNAVVVTVSLVIGTIFFGILLKVTGLEHSMYYRPHEMFSVYDTALGHRRYQKNVHFEMQMPHGDLKVKDFSQQVVPEPRNVVFKTDSLGYRNNQDYHGQQYVLVGDSFLAGSGISQKVLITEQLLTKYGIDSYNLAHPGGIEEYAGYMNNFNKMFKSQFNFKFVLFFFEGNDFNRLPKHTPNEAQDRNNRVISSLKRYYKLFNKTSIYRFTSSALRKILYQAQNHEMKIGELVVGEPPMSLFYFMEYKEVSDRKSLTGQDHPPIEQYLEERADDIASIFFIPTKYRVYYNLSQSKPQKALPHLQWEYIQKVANQLDIRATDLTPVWVNESKKLLQEGQLTFWRDDTHWNPNGIAVAAQKIAKTLTEQDAP